MKIIIVSGSFKRNMNIPEACSIIEAGIFLSNKDIIVYKFTLADGGEETARTVPQTASGRFVKINVAGPLGRKIETEFGLIEDGKVAILNVVGTSGIELVD